MDDRDEDPILSARTGGNYYQHSSNSSNDSNNKQQDQGIRQQHQEIGTDNLEQEPLNLRWQFTDFGHVGEYSRDGSVHATDEVFNSASHLVGTLLSLLGSALLIVQASAMGAPWKIVAFSIYGASLVFLFGASTLHHSIVGPSRLEQFLRMLDYLAIYPLIAGTFTPLCLVFFHNQSIGWTFFGTIWFLAFCGMIMTACIFTKIPKWLSMTLYISMGWLGACMSYWLIPYLGTAGMALLILGGVWFTAGGYVFSTEQPNPIPGKFGFHEIWHCAVLLGAMFHWALMFAVVLPWQPTDEEP